MASELEGPRFLLDRVVSISDTCVLLAPRETDTLDLHTISRAPPAHRNALQRNGLVAKVFLTAKFSDDDVQADALSPGGSRSLWHSALRYTGLIADSAAALAVPPAHAEDEWPLLTEARFQARIRYLMARQQSAELNTSSFCVPLLSVRQLLYKDRHVRVSVGVAWMPRYAQSLTQWAESRIAASGKPVAEAHLMGMLQQVTLALMTLQKAALPSTDGLSAGDTRMGCPAGFDADCVLVHEEDGRITFSLVASPMSLAPKDREMADSLASSRYAQLGHLPYLAPEQVYPPKTPIISRPRYAVWALGAVALAIGRGTPSIASQITCQAGRKMDVPLNHPSLTPDAILSRVRRDLAAGGYTVGLVSLLGLMLAQDHLTRPQLGTVDAMLQDLHRAIPVHRFPFALGDLSLLRVPSPESLLLNPSARKYVTQDLCCLCKLERHKRPCRSRPHAPAATSPVWRSDEPLPGLLTSGEHGSASYMTYLYPLEPPNLDEKERRRLLAGAVQGRRALDAAAGGPSSDAARQVSCRDEDATVPGGPGARCGRAPAAARAHATMVSTADTATLNRASLFQLMGGFAMFDESTGAPTQAARAKDRGVIRDVFVPFPTTALRRAESGWSVLELSFTAALPWPSYCTRTLQKKGRVSAQVPGIFGGCRSSSGSSGSTGSPNERVPKYFAWLTPGESLSLENGRLWTPAPDGGFVLWFHEDLEPSDMDRYFAVTSVRAGTLGARARLTVLPDPILRKHAGAEGRERDLDQSMSSRCELLSRHGSLRRPGPGPAPASSALRRCCSQSVTLIEVPASNGIAEDESHMGPASRSCTQSIAFMPMGRVSSTQCGRGVEESAGNVSGGGNARGRQAQPAATAKTAHATSHGPLAGGGPGEKQTVGSGSDAPEVVPAAGERERNESKRMHRLPSLAQRRPRLASLSFTAVADAVCHSPIVESTACTAAAPARHASRRSREASEEQRSREGGGMIPASAPPTSALPRRAPSAKDLHPLAATAAAAGLAAPLRSVNTNRPESAAMAPAKTRPPMSVPVGSGERPAEALPLALHRPSREGSLALPPTPVRVRRDGTPSSVPAVAAIRTTVPVPRIALPTVTVHEPLRVRGLPVSPHTTAAAPAAPVSLFARWVAAAHVDAPFDSLTFYVPATHEHGSLQPPVALSEAARAALHCPAAAQFLSFMSNSTPLLRRNHRSESAVAAMLFPHHGMALYGSDGSLLGALALRCGPAGGLEMEPEVEFPIMVTSMPPRVGTTIGRGAYDAAYFSLSDTPQYCQSLSMISPSPSPSRQWGRHNGLGGQPLVSPQDCTLLTFSSARMLLGDLTPTSTPPAAELGEAPASALDLPLHSHQATSNTAGLPVNPDTMLPVCWMGYDAETGALVFADVDQSVWYPLVIC